MENNKFNTLEKFFFLLIVGLNLIPILSGKFFPTLDGAAHLYNSQIINTLFFDGKTELSNFFILNQQAVPNWTGHFILSFFNLFLPAFIAEKILLLFYMIGLPLAFRALVKTISPNKHLLASYLIFPFTYSFVFFLGFYNFSIAIVFTFLTLNFWLKNEEKLASIKTILILFSLIALTYFSHIFVFAILLLLIGLQITVKAINKIVHQSKPIKDIFNNSFKKAGFLLLSASIPLILFIQYLISKPYYGEDTFITNTDLINSLKNMSSIIAYDAMQEERYTTLIFKILAILFLIALFKGIRKIKFSSNFFHRTKLLSNIRTLTTDSNFWLFGIITILILYFKLPDSDGSAGFVSVRLGMLFFIYLIIWLSTQRLSKWIGILSVIVLLYSNFKLNKYYIPLIMSLNKVAVNCNELSEHIPANSIVLTLDFTDNWLLSHYSNYLGIDKPMVLMENYEAATGYFPVNWNQNTMPNTLFGDLSWNDVPCIEWHSNTANNEQVIEYVFVLGELDSKVDSCNQIVKQNLSNYYMQTFRNESCTLYQRKRK